MQNRLLSHGGKEYAKQIDPVSTSRHYRTIPCVDLGLWQTPWSHNGSGWQTPWFLHKGNWTLHKRTTQWKLTTQMMRWNGKHHFPTHTPRGGQGETPTAVPLSSKERIEPNYFFPGKMPNQNHAKKNGTSMIRSPWCQSAFQNSDQQNYCWCFKSTTSQQSLEFIYQLTEPWHYAKHSPKLNSSKY